MMKFFRRSLYALLGLCVLFIAALCFMFYTPTGLQWTLRVASHFTQQQLNYSDVNGTIGTGFSAKRISYQNPDIDLVISDATIHLNPWALLLKTVSVQQLRVTNIQMINTDAASSTSDTTQTSEQTSEFQLPVSIKLNDLNIKQLSYEDQSIQASISNLVGKVRLSPSHDQTQIHVNTNWDELKLIKQQNNVAFNNTQLVANGSLKHYSGQFTSNVTYSETGSAPQTIQTQLVFQGSESAIGFKTFKINSTLGKLSGHAQLQWQPTLQWDIQIESGHLQNQLPKQNLNAAINFQLLSKGEQTKQGLSGFLKLQNLTGTLNKKSLTGAVNLEFSPKQFNFKDTYFHMNDTQLKIAGGLNHRWDLNWTLTIPQLSHLFATGQGKIVSNGTITGPKAKPEIKAKLNASQINALGLMLKELHANFDIKPKATSHLQLSANTLQYNNIKIDKLAINGVGSLASNSLNLVLNSPEYNLSTQLQGRLQQKIWLGKISKFTVQQPQFGVWQLQKPSELQLGQSAKTSAFMIRLQNFCLANQTQNFCLSIAKDAQNFSIQAQLDKLKLSYLLAMLSQENMNIINSNSLINLTLDYHNGDNPEGSIKGEITPGTISFSDNGQTQVTRITHSAINGTLKNNQLTAKADISLSKAQALRAELTVNNLNAATKAQTLQGSVDLNYNDLSLLSKFFPIIQKASGSINGQMTLAGTVASPQISGKLNLANGFINIPSYGLNIKNIKLNAIGAKTGRIEIKGQVDSGGGILNIDGYINPITADMPAVLNLEGSNVLVMDTTGYQFYASPNLTIRKQGLNITVNGSILIPKALIAPTDFSQGGIALSDDVEFVHAPKAISKYLITGDIKLLTGKDIKIDVKGLTGNVTGELELFYNSATNSTATGTLQVENGEFNAYGQKLKLQTGKVIYNSSPLDNPGLNVKAYKTITVQTTAASSTLGKSFSIPTSFNQGSQVNVGVNVIGTVKQYKITLFSDPAMYSQSDILSLILTGETADNISSNSAQLLLRAASSMNLGGNSIGDITQQLKQSFGLDELGIADENTYGSDGSLTSTTSLVLGKHLTPRLFISYSIGILDPVSIFRASYLLAKNWRLDADASSNDTGADIFYTINK